MNIFVASTFSDLKNYRDKARRSIEMRNHRAELVEPLAGVEPQAIAHLLQSIVHTCHGCILIVGSRRGSGPRDHAEGIDGESFTMIEFLESIRSNIPLIPFVLESATNIDVGEQQWVHKFRQLISTYAEPIKISSLDEFEERLNEELARLEQQTPPNPSERETRPLPAEHFRELFGGLGEAALNFTNSAQPGDVQLQRNKAQLQGYPAQTDTPEFRRADDENTLGWDCHLVREYSAALVHYERALTLYQAFPLAWNNKGLAHYRLGELEQAKQCYFSAVQYAPGFVKPWSNLAFLYWTKYEDADAARRWLSRAFAISPDYPDAKMIETAIQYAGHLEPQVQTPLDRCFVRLLKRYPRETIWFHMPAAREMVYGDFATALQRLLEALKTAPEVAEFLDPTAECLCHLNRYAEGEVYAREAVQQDPTYAPGWVTLSWTLAGQGNYVDCLEAATRALALEAAPETHGGALSNAVIAACELHDFARADLLIDDFARTHADSDRINALRSYVNERR